MTFQEMVKRFQELFFRPTINNWKEFKVENKENGENGFVNRYEINNYEYDIDIEIDLDKQKRDLDSLSKNNELMMRPNNNNVPDLAIYDSDCNCLVELLDSSKIFENSNETEITKILEGERSSQSSTYLNFYKPTSLIKHINQTHWLINLNASSIGYKEYGNCRVTEKFTFDGYLQNYSNFSSVLADDTDSTNNNFTTFSSVACCSQFSRIYIWIWLTIIVTQLLVIIKLLFSSDRELKICWKWLMKILEQLIRVCYFFHIFYLDNVNYQTGLVYNIPLHAAFFIIFFDILQTIIIAKEGLSRGFLIDVLWIFPIRMLFEILYFDKWDHCDSGLTLGKCYAPLFLTNIILTFFDFPYGCSMYRKKYQYAGMGRNSNDIEHFYDRIMSGSSTTTSLGKCSTISCSEVSEININEVDLQSAIASCRRARGKQPVNRLSKMHTITDVAVMANEGVALLKKEKRRQKKEKKKREKILRKQERRRQKLHATRTRWDLFMRIIIFLYPIPIALVRVAIIFMSGLYCQERNLGLTINQVDDYKIPALICNPILPLKIYKSPELISITIPFLFYFLHSLFRCLYYLFVFCFYWPLFCRAWGTDEEYQMTRIRFNFSEGFIVGMAALTCVYVVYGGVIVDVRYDFFGLS